MLRRRLRSEYMRRFPEPPRAACRSCYEELLRYRRGRRLLEGTHRPWLWEEPGAPGSGGAERGPETEQEKQAEAEYVEQGIDQTEDKEQPAHPDTHRAPSRPPHSQSPPRAQSNTRRPFALYANGEKRTDTGSKKTHNVCAPAADSEIHDSALRAKSRRQKEKIKELLQKQRAQTADVGKRLRKESTPPENPWLTEYMRCYSARER